jgi:PAS domain S-box-containing protein
MSRKHIVPELWSVFTALPVLGVVVDSAGDIRCVNEAWKRAAQARAGAGGTQGLSEGANYLDVCARSAQAGDEIAGQIREALAAVFSGKRDLYTVEYPCPQPDRPGWFLLCATFLQDLGETVVLHFNITQQRVRDKQLVLQEEHQRLILESTSELISTHTTDGTFVFASAAASDLLGQPPDQLLGRSLLDFICPLDHLRFLSACHHVLDPIPVQRESVRTRMLRRNGSWFWVETVLRPLHAKGQPEGEVFLAVTRDITATMEAEAQGNELKLSLERAAFEWRATFDAVSLPIFLLEVDGRLRRMNRAAKELAGRSYRELLGKTIAELGSCQPWEQMSALVASFPTGTPAWACEAHDEKNGKTWEIEASLCSAPETDPRVVVQVKDITERVSLEESLRRSETMAVLGSVVGGVAHEVRNPLFGMSSVLDALQGRLGGSSEYSPYIELLRKELRRLMDLMQTLLNYGRPARFEMAPGNPLDVLQTALEICQPLADQRHVRIEIVAPESARQVLLDPKQLVQAFRNLIENALQHSPEKSIITIEISVSNREEQDWLRISICDQGAGFAPADLPKVWEPFFTRRSGGTGLGLSIVMRIVEGHGGRVQAFNQEEGGAAVLIELPIIREAS